jgi:hypothetical protein
VCESLHYLLLGAGEAENVMGTVGDSEMDEIETADDFEGWHPQYTGTDW